MWLYVFYGRGRASGMKFGDVDCKGNQRKAVASLFYLLDQWQLLSRTLSKVLHCIDLALY